MNEELHADWGEGKGRDITRRRVPSNSKLLDLFSRFLGALAGQRGREFAYTEWPSFRRVIPAKIRRGKKAEECIARLHRPEAMLKLLDLAHGPRLHEFASECGVEIPNLAAVQVWLRELTFGINDQRALPDGSIGWKGPPIVLVRSALLEIENLRDIECRRAAAIGVAQRDSEPGSGDTIPPAVVSKGYAVGDADDEEPPSSATDSPTRPDSGGSSASSRADGVVPRAEHRPPETIGDARAWLARRKAVVDALGFTGRGWLGNLEVYLGAPQWRIERRPTLYRLGDVIQALHRAAQMDGVDLGDLDQQAINDRLRRKLLPPDYEPDWAAEASIRRGVPVSRG